MPQAREPCQGGSATESGSGENGRAKWIFFATETGVYRQAKLEIRNTTEGR